MHAGHMFQVDKQVSPRLEGIHGWMLSLTWEMHQSAIISCHKSERFECLFFKAAELACISGIYFLHKKNVTHNKTKRQFTNQGSLAKFFVINQ